MPAAYFPVAKYRNGGAGYNSRIYQQEIYEYKEWNTKKVYSAIITVG
jgi:hypothetical protein